MTRDPREEAERLVAAALAAVSVAARGTTGFATGSAECCVCPLCKAIAAMRDPDPTFAERLASGAGDLATGLAGMLRAFGAATTGTGSRDDDGPSEPSDPASATPSSWSAATGSAPAASADRAAADRSAADGSSEHTGFGNIASSGASAGTRKQAEPADDVWHAATAPPARPMARKAVKKKAEPDA